MLIPSNKQVISISFVDRCTFKGTVCVLVDGGVNYSEGSYNKLIGDKQKV